MTPRGRLFLVPAAVLAACAPRATVPGGPVPGPHPMPDQPPPALEVGPPPEPIAPPADALRRGWMPLAGTGVDAFRAAHPTYDGRGVLIAILDSGIDPSVPGLVRTSTGTRKLVDLRDLSGEGRVALAAVTLDGDSVRVAGRTLGGAGRLRGLSATGPYLGGALSEVPLGTAPAADLNGNRVVGDSLPVVVLRASDGWVVLADTDGNGSFANERPVRDFRVAAESFGWAPPGATAPAGVAVNLVETLGGVPTLDLVFDNSGHGTHVAGIAAGQELFGLAGFDGVAPGAELIGIKISNNARGAITVTGSILAGMDYAIRQARQRRMPLVINLSFGVGNEAEGAARIDALVDSVLAANPDVVMTVSAGNDGPGLSTIGFPGSASRVVSVGASYPGAFLPPDPFGRTRPDLVAFFSARGGELARPDLIAPGLAYSSIPRWDVGEEVKTGTSMAAPHVAGLAASLVSGLTAERRPVDAAAIRAALLASARPVGGGGLLDQGAGQPDLARAWALVRDGGMRTGASARFEGPGDLSGAVLVLPAAGGADTTLRLRVEGPETYRLRTDVPWLEVPPSVTPGARGASLTVRVRPGAVSEWGLHPGVLAGWGADTTRGPAFRIPVSLVRPHPARVDTVRLDLAPGATRRVFVLADSGRPFRVTAADGRGAPLLVFLHEPGGMPARGGAGAIAGLEEPEAVLAVDGRDGVAGAWEVVTIAGPSIGVRPMLVLDPAPLRFSLSRGHDSLELQATGLAATPAAGSLQAELLGAERGILASGNGSDDLRFAFRIPAWAAGVEVDLSLDRDQWPRFTDFGLTLEDGAGRVLAAAPMNYAHGRLSFATGGVERDAAVVLSPAFADAGSVTRWYGRITIRLYAAEPVPAGAPLPVRVEPGASWHRSLPVAPAPWPLGDAFHLLGRARFEADGRSWTAEGGLAPPLPPIMR